MAMLLAAMPALAEPAGESTSSPPAASDPDPGLEPWLDQFTVEEAPPGEQVEEAPAPAAPSDTSDSPSDAAAPSRDTSSAIETEVDEEFRRQLAEKQARIEAFKAQLDELDRELAIAVESYNQALVELEETRARLEMTGVDLENAREAYQVQSELLAERVREMYFSGDLTVLELLLDSKNFSDFFGRIKFLGIVGEHDTDLATQLANQREQIEKDVVDLESAELQAEALEFDLKARQIEIMLRIEERQQMLLQAEVELLDFLDEEAVQRNVEQQALLNAVLAGAGELGITVGPGSPVETALAYHGIPYVWAGEKPSGFDCSGLVLYVFKQHGVTLPHYSGSQFLLGEKVLPQDLRPGDVVFFGSPIHHVGIYMGGGYYIHAPRTGDFVKVSRLLDRSDYAGARRYDWKPRVGAPLGGTLPSMETTQTVTAEG
jgi:peptidoglycan hydrolase CwlO-like protein